MKYSGNLVPIDFELPEMRWTKRRRSNFSEYLALLDIIEKERIDTVFQPIIHLRTGNVWGCEALSRIEGESPFSGPEALFQSAREFGMTFRLEKLCRKKALLNAHNRAIPVPVTINVCPSVLKSPDHEKGTTLSLMDELSQFRDQVILELTEKYYISDNRLFRDTVNYYRRQGFRIAIDDLGAGYAGLNMLIQIEPFMVKIDRTLIENIHNCPKKQMLLESLISFCHKINSQVVAEGIEEQEEMDMVAELGIDFGQGYFLGKPAPFISVDRFEKKTDMETTPIHIRDKTFESGNEIGCLVSRVSSVGTEQTVTDLLEYFKKDPSATCVPVLDMHNRPVGILQKHRLFFKLGQRFGYDLFSRKPVKTFMEPCMVFDWHTCIEKVSRAVISRNEDVVYDSVIITRDGKYRGIVKVFHLLEKITQQKIDMARQANPLSGLPGNRMIKNEIERRLSTGLTFAVLYFDLDHFKPFNDNYGFYRGDSVIHFLGNLLERSIKKWDVSAFIGHVGGDDFVAICRAHGVSEMCRNIISIFDEEIKTFHDEITRRKGHYSCLDRKGKKQKYPLLSLSIGCVTNEHRMFSSYAHIASVASEVKKKAKMIPGSSFYQDRRFDK